MTTNHTITKSNRKGDLFIIPNDKLYWWISVQTTCFIKKDVDLRRQNSFNTPHAQTGGLQSALHW
jgi:hypothetical protein